MRFMVLLLSIVLVSCAGNSNKKTKPPYLTDAISKHMLKAANPSPEKQIIHITALSKDLDERWYFNQCFQTIDASKGNSPRSGLVRVSYTIALLDGGLVDVRVLQSSGFIDLDEHVVSLIRQSGPFPKAPDSLALRAHRATMIQSISVTRMKK